MKAALVKAALQTIAAGATLDETEMSRVLDAMTDGGATPAQMGAFLMGLRVRGETVAEITGAARLMRERMIIVAVPEGTVDIVGTGGDGHNTYNVSTCAAFVAAGAGLKVAKHGNRSVSSLSGASDVLAALGVKIDVPVETVARAVREAGVGFLWAPMHHPAFKAWAPVRADLSVRTMFNLLGPICNPARVKRQIVGVFDERWVKPVAEVLRNLGTEWAWVVHGRDGLDELSTTGPTLVAELASGQVRTFEVDPREVGLHPSSLADLRGGDAEANAKALRGVLAGEPGAYRDIVLLNTGAALLVGGAATDLADGVVRAAASIDSGAAAAALARLIAITKG